MKIMRYDYGWFFDFFFVPNLYYTYCRFKKCCEFYEIHIEYKTLQYIYFFSYKNLYRILTTYIKWDYNVKKEIKLRNIKLLILPALIHYGMILSTINALNAYFFFYTYIFFFSFIFPSVHINRRRVFFFHLNKK